MEEQMDFKEKIGEKLERLVTKVTPKSGSPHLSFGCEFLGFDAMLYSAMRDAMTQAERDAEDRERERGMEDYYDGFVSSFSYRRRATPDPQYSSMRIYHVHGRPPKELIEGDEWDTVIERCYLNPHEKLTKDNRHKIHFSLRPVKKVVLLEQTIDRVNLQITISHRCGRNHSRETKPCAVEERSYRDENDLWAYIVREYSVEGKVISRETPSMISANAYMAALQEKSGIHMEAKRLRAMYRELPILPR